MIHHVHGATCVPSCIAYDNTRTIKDLVITGLTNRVEHVTCRNCWADIDDTGNITLEAARAQNRATGYDPMGFAHAEDNASAIFPDPTIAYTVIILPKNCNEDATKRDLPDQPGFAMDQFQHFTAREAVAFAEREAGPDGFASVYLLTAFPRHIPAHEPVAYYYQQTWHRVV